MKGLVPILLVVIFGRWCAASELFPYGQDAGDWEGLGGEKPLVNLPVPLPYSNGVTTPDIVVSAPFIVSVMEMSKNHFAGENLVSVKKVSKKH